MQAAAPPAVVETAPVQAPAEFVVVRRDHRSEVVFSTDTPLPLIKAGRTEEAMLRQALFVTITHTVVRSTTSPNSETLRWTYEPFFQQSLCFTSMTGQFGCTVAEVVGLPDTYSGEAPNMPAPTDGNAANPAAEAARAAVTNSLRARGPVIFAENRRLKIDPMLKAAAVTVRGAAKK